MATFAPIHIHAAYASLTIKRILQVQHTERCFDKVASEIAKRTRPIVPPSSPASGNQFVNVVLIRRCSQPKIPVKFRRYSSFWRPGNSLWPYRSVSPDLHRVYISNDACIIPLLKLTVPRRLMHLGFPFASRLYIASLLP